ncbi:MAG: flagellar brake domain-containing protein [Veillonellales bacterium]
MELKDFFADFWECWDNFNLARRRNVITEERILKINQRVEIMFGKKSEQQYHSRIEDITPTTIILAMPMDKSVPVLLSPGTVFFGKAIDNGAVYHFTSTFIDKKILPLPVWIASPPRDIRKIQQRAFVRIDAVLPVNIEIEDEAEENSVRLLQVFTRDISGGGIQAICKEPLKLGSQLRLQIDIPEFGRVETIGKVVRMEQPQDLRNLFWISIKFIDIPEGIRRKIIKFIFKKQLEHRQKGL